MAKKTRRKKSAKGRIRRGEHVTPQRLMELSFAYAPPLIIGEGVSNKVFDSLEDGAKPSPYVPSALRREAGACRCLTVKRRRRAGLSSAKNAVCQFSTIARHRARARRLGKHFVLQWKFRATHSGPIFVGGVKQFSVASTVVEAHLRNKSPISSSSSRYSAVASTTVLGNPMTWL